MTWVAIAIGGALGSMARHAVNELTNAPRFPWGTVIVNVSGCFVIGLLAGLLACKRMTLWPYAREFVFVGMLGGFTTFSTFGLDTLGLAQSSSSGRALLNVTLQVVGGLAAVWIGYRIGTA